MYAIREITTGKLLHFSAEANDPCMENVSVTFTLCTTGYGVWLTKTYDAAKYVLDNTIGWYNADYECASISKFIDRSKLEVVEVDLMIKTCRNIRQ